MKRLLELADEIDELHHELVRLRLAPHMRLLRQRITAT